MKLHPPSAARSTAAARLTLPCAALAGWWILASAGWLQANPDTPLNPTISLATRPSGEVAVLRWDSIPGAACKVQFQTALNPAAWQDYDVVTPTGATTTVEVPLSVAGPGAAANRLFFRVLPPQTMMASVEPALLRTTGGQLYVTGQCFEAGDLVRINGVDFAANFLGHTTLLVNVPSLPAGVFDVEVVRAGNVIASLTDALTTTSGLPLESIEPPGLPPGAPVAKVMGAWTASTFGDCPPIAYSFAPAAPASGEVHTMRMDLAIPGRGLDFIWATTYRSRNGEATAMGNNWAHSYDIRCTPNGTDMDVRDGTGRRDTFFLQPDGSFSKRGLFRRGTLAATTFTLEFAEKGRWVFRPLDGSPAAGKIAQSINRNGNAMQFNYDGAGRLAAIVDTLNRVYLVNYDGNGRLSAVTDFTGRAVTYTYYGAGNPLGPQGALRMIRSPLVTGTPTGNDFPTGKTTTFTYSTGFADARLDNNLLTITDPKGQTSRRFAYAATLNPADVEFDRVVSMQLGDALDPIDQPAVFTWLEQTPSPANSYARLKLIANDPVGNVTTRLFESRNLPVTHIRHTGRSMPGVAVTETTNLPAGQLRASDPDFFTTSATWNLNFLPTRITLPRGNGRAFSWESDFNPAANPRELGNLRTLREVGTAGELLVWRVEHLAGFGTVESFAPFRPRRVTPGPSVRGSQRAEVTGPGGEELPTDKYSRVKVQFHWDREGKSDARADCRADASRLMEEEGIYYYLEGDPDQPIVTGSVYNSSRLMEEEGIFYLLRSMDGGATGSFGAWPRQTVDISSSLRGGAGGGALLAWPESANDYQRVAGGGVFAMDTDTNGDGDPDQLSFYLRDHNNNVTQFLASRTGRGTVTSNLNIYSTRTGGGGTIMSDPAGIYCTSLTNPRGHITTFTYDAAGNRTREQSPLAATADEFTYNAFGQFASHLHPANGSGSQRLDTFTYYNAGPQNGYLADAIADAGGLGLTTHYEYDPRGNVVRVVDPRLNDTLLTRNQLNQVVRASSPIVNGARNERDFIYDANGNVVRVDVQNRDETGAFDPNTHFSSTFTYDFRNCVTSRTDEIDGATTRTTQLAYDGNRDLARITLPEAVSGADPNNVFTIFVDERCLLLSVVRAPGVAGQSTTQYDYTLNGRLAAYRQGIENAPRVTTFAYDGHSRLTGSTDALGNVRALTLDDAGNVTRMTITGNAEPLPAPPRLLFAANFTYNALHQLMSSRVEHFDPLTGAPIGDGVRTTTLTRAPNQQLTQLRDENNTLHSFAYDGASRLTRLTDARGNRTDATLDANGNPTALLWTDKRDSGAPDEQFQMTYSYDTLSRLVSSQDNVGNTMTCRYDSRGNLTRFTDPGGGDTIYQYDGLSRPTRTVEDMDATGSESPPDITRIYEYDGNSRLTRVTDDNSNVTSYAWDSLNRLNVATGADGVNHEFFYDVHHNVTSETDCNDSASSCTYDLANHLIRRDITPGPGVAGTTTFETFAWDGMSRLLRAENDTSLITRRYDSHGNLVTETLDGRDTVSTYDGAGNRRTLTYPGGRVLTYTHDALHRVVTINDGSLLVTKLYAGRDRLERADYGNGTRLVITWDGQLGGPVVAGDFGWQRPVSVIHSKGGPAFHTLLLTWDRNQNKLSRVRFGGGIEQRSFQYDAADRLIRSIVNSSGPAVDTQYQFDGESNRLQVTGGLNPGTYTRDATAPVPADFQMNQYSATPGDTRLYDDAGNVKQTIATGPTGVTRTISYDYAGRLVTAVMAGGLQADYRYDALGRRIRRDIAPPGPPLVATTHFYYDGPNCIEETLPITAGGAVQALYVIDGTGTWDIEGDAIVAYARTRAATYPYFWTIRAQDSQNQVAQQAYSLAPLMMRRGGQDSWFAADDNGNTVALTNAAGTVAERYHYDDYGTVAFLTAAGAVIPGATQSAAGNPYLFHAWRYDPETALYAPGERPGFDPAAGVMLQRASK